MSTPAERERWERVERIFEQARGLEVSERTTFVERTCGADRELAAEVLSLLEADTRAESVLVPPGGGELESWLERPAGEDLVGREVGGCRLTRLIARGGMGVVYEAIQSHPRRTVAVKLLRAGIATAEEKQRFEYEARLLANLRHAAIAQVYEAGTYAGAGGESAPYFVMEYVPGARALTTYADQEGLALEARLELFVRICEAVHCGHQKGVIHRDLKPANLLVGADGCPKVIDFGIARASAGELAAGTTLTSPGQLLGTLAYMSPEQAEGRSQEIDTRSDVYALGMVLYELLTGARPYEVEGLGLLDAAEVIRLRPPVPPSRRCPHLPADLELIILTALAKEARGRYASAEALGRDIRRWLSSEPIQARPPTLLYQARLFARRHRALVAAVAASLLALVGGALVSLLFALDAERARASEQQRAREAQAARTRAENLLGHTRVFMRWSIGEFYERLADVPGTSAARRAMAERLEGALSALRAQGARHPWLLEVLAVTLRRLAQVCAEAQPDDAGRGEEVLGYLARAAGLFEELHRVEPAEKMYAEPVAGIKIDMARELFALGRAGEARALVRRALDGYETLRAQHPGDGEIAVNHARALEFAAQLELQEGRAEAALSHLEEACERIRKLAGPAAASRAGKLFLAALQGRIGGYYLATGRLEEARPRIAAALEIVDALVASGSASTSVLRAHSLASMRMGDYHRRKGEWQAARSLYERSLAIDERLAAADQSDAQARSDLAVSCDRLGKVLCELGESQRAVGYHKRALAIARQAAAAEPENLQGQLDLRIALRVLASTCQRCGDLDRARSLLEESLEVAEGAAREHPGDPRAQAARAEALDFLGNHENELARRSAKSADQRHHLEEARTWWARSLAVYETLGARGLLPPWASQGPQSLRSKIATAQERLRAFK